ncbi:MAG: transposase [Cutibacterium sp.]|nr:transposase [Cutibacterium sp.]
MGLEIISGVERRRRWSDADKLRIVAEADEAGAKVAEVARRHEISRSILWAWRKQARAGVLATPDPLDFLPVVVDAPIAAASVPSAVPLQVDAPPPPDHRAITITLANGTRLEISASLSLPALSCIIGALR